MNKVLEWKRNGNYHFKELGSYDSIILKMDLRHI